MEFAVILLPAARGGFKSACVVWRSLLSSCLFVSGAEWSGVEWSGVEWSGVEWSGVQWSGVVSFNGTDDSCHRVIMNGWPGSDELI